MCCKNTNRSAPNQPSTVFRILYNGFVFDIIIIIFDIIIILNWLLSLAAGWILLSIGQFLTMNTKHRRILRDKRNLLKIFNFQHLKQILSEYKKFHKYMMKVFVSMGVLLDGLSRLAPKAPCNIIEKFRKAEYDQDTDALENFEDKMFYEMSSQCLGYCVIINNMTFEKFDLHGISEPAKNLDRLGSDTDADSLYYLFKNAGFKVDLEKNKKANEITNILQELSKQEELTNVDCLVVIIMSHGAQRGNVDVIYGTDWYYVEKSHLCNIFNNENCVYLQRKPKVFIFISCRCKVMDYGVSQYQPDKSLDTDCDRSMKYDVFKSLPNSVSLDAISNIVTPTVTDTFIVHSTLPCQVSLRHDDDGSYFCQALIDVLKREFSNHDLPTIINLVNQQLHSKVSPLYRIVQSAHYEALGTTKSVKFFPHD